MNQFWCPWFFPSMYRTYPLSVPDRRSWWKKCSAMIVSSCLWWGDLMQVPDSPKRAERIENPIRMGAYSRPCSSSDHRNMIHNMWYGLSKWFLDLRPRILEPSQFLNWRGFHSISIWRVYIIIITITSLSLTICVSSELSWAELCCSSCQRGKTETKHKRIEQRDAAHPCHPQTLVLAILTSSTSIIQGAKFMRDPVGNLVGPTRSFH